MDGINLRETIKSLHGPVKHQLIMHGQFTCMLTYKQSNTCQEIFIVHKLGRSSIVAIRESIIVDKEHSKWCGGQASVDNYKRWYAIVLSAVDNATNIQSLYEYRATKLTLELPNLPWKKVTTDLFYWKASTCLLIVDYYSRYTEISKLNGHSSEVISYTKSFLLGMGISRSCIQQ